MRTVVIDGYLYKVKNKDFREFNEKTLDIDPKESEKNKEKWVAELDNLVEKSRKVCWIDDIYYY